MVVSILLKKRLSLGFSIAQTFTEILEAIREFLINLPNGHLHSNSICIYDVPKSKVENKNLNDVVQLSIFKNFVLHRIIDPSFD